MLTFEDCLPIIDQEIQKRRPRWTLTIAWLDWDDIAQNLRIHISKKFHLWKQDLPIRNWLAAVIHNQLVNIIRNLHTNCAPVCNKCAAFDGNDGCSIYGEKRDNCPYFSTWKRNKESAYNIRFPLSSIYHEQEIHDISHTGIDLEKEVESVHSRMKETLNHQEFLIYSCLFIKFKTVEETAKLVPYCKNKNKNLQRIKDLKEEFIKKAKEIIFNSDFKII